MNELTIAQGMADGTLPSPQQFMNSYYWLVRISGVGAAWRNGVGEYVWRTRKSGFQAKCVLGARAYQS